MFTSFDEDNSSSVTFSGNRAGKGGSDMYGAILMGCDTMMDITGNRYIPHVGHPMKPHGTLTLLS